MDVSEIAFTLVPWICTTYGK